MHTTRHAPDQSPAKSSATLRRRPAASWAALAVSATLAACGGGGDGTSADASVAISATNRDTVAQTTAAAAMGLGVSDLGVLVTPASAGNAGTAARGHQWVPTRVLLLLRSLVTDQPTARALAAAGEGQQRALATVGPFTDNCAYAGSMTYSINDADGSLSVNAGDTMVVSFSNCQEAPGSTLNGSLNVTYEAVSRSPSLSVTALLSMDNLRGTEPNSAIALNGALRMEYTVLTSSTQRLTMTATRTNTAEVQGSSGAQTVTLYEGYREQSIHDSLAATSSSTVAGVLGSSRLGGRFTVSTPTAIVSSDAALYPHAGVVLAQGNPGALRLTVLSTTQVQLDLDADGNGTYESSSTVGWASLI